MGFISSVCCGNGSEQEANWRWRVFSFKELYSATNGFDCVNMLGEGSLGIVYWGQLWDGSQIAVKRLKTLDTKTEREFAEVEVLRKVSHKNLMNLRGYCAEGQDRLIVYDYMPNSSLHSHLHGQYSADCLLDWSRRMQIAIGSAEGILYLHHHATPRIIHRDIKASNILLDSDFQPTIAGFKSAKFVPEGATYVTTRVVKGTLGYLAPEYAMLGRASESCDVYSFGIVLLELATGKKPTERLSPTTRQTVTEWAVMLVREKRFEQVADPKLNGDFVEPELRRVVLVALVCARIEPDKRPTMLEVVQLLRGESEATIRSLEDNEMFRPVQADKSRKRFGTGA